MVSIPPASQGVKFDLPVSTLTASTDTRILMHSLIYRVQAWQKKQQTNLAQASRDGEIDCKLVWEVFAGPGRTYERLKRRGARVETFLKKREWDFCRPKDQKRFIKKLQEEQPNGVLYFWNANCRRLCTRSPWLPIHIQSRRQNHDNILTFVATVYEIKYRGANMLASSTRPRARLTNQTAEGLRGETGPVRVWPEGSRP